MANNTSFLPEDYLEKRIERCTNLICLGLFVVVSAATIGAFYVRDFQVIAVRKQHKSINDQFE